MEETEKEPKQTFRYEEVLVDDKTPVGPLVWSNTTLIPWICSSSCGDPPRRPAVPPVATSARSWSFSSLKDAASGLFHLSYFFLHQNWLVCSFHGNENWTGSPFSENWRLAVLPNGLQIIWLKQQRRTSSWEHVNVFGWLTWKKRFNLKCIINYM